MSNVEVLNKNNDVSLIDLGEVFHILLKRWYLILLCCVLTMGSMYLVTQYLLKPVYRAQTSIFISSGKSTQGDVGYWESEFNRKLIIDYIELIKSRLVTKEVIESLGLSEDLHTFQDHINATKTKDSRMLIISFESDNPQVAADVANKLAEMLKVKASEVMDTSHANIIDKAEVPTRPISPDLNMNLIVAGMVGLMLGGFLAFLLEYMNQALKKPEEVEKYLGVNVVGMIPKFSGILKGKKGKDHLQLSDSPTALKYLKSPVAEAYRSLRTNICFSSTEKQKKTIVVTSPSPNEGKTTTAVNLAISMAQAGIKVLLVDADLRNPKIHQYFSINNGSGLTEVLSSDNELLSHIKSFKYIPNLFILTSGSVPPNPSELLGSGKTNSIMDELKNQFDIIILDTPPISCVTDPMILSAVTDATLLVFESGRTSIDLAKRSIKALQCVKAKILGAALVKMNLKFDGVYYKLV